MRRLPREGRITYPQGNPQMEQLITTVKKLRGEGMSYKEIDEALGFPEKWGGRIAWALVNRPAPPWTLEPARETQATLLSEFKAPKLAQTTELCEQCGEPLEEHPVQTALAHFQQKLATLTAIQANKAPKAKAKRAR